MPKKAKTSTETRDFIDETRLLQAVLAQVPFDGWSRAALLHGAQSIGLGEGHVQLTYPHGVRDAVATFSAWANEAMMRRIEAERLYDRMRVRDRVAFAVRARLEAQAPHREAVRALGLWYALPQHAPEALRNMAQLTDVIWRAAGDSSTDFNFYTKRGLLALVVKATTLFWLDDNSPDQKASWDFLDRRIAEVLRLGQAFGQLQNLPAQLGKLGRLADAARFFRRAA